MSLRLVAAALLALAAAAPSRAGQSCEERPLAAHEVVLSMDLAQRTVQALEASGARVALVARAGQDLSRYRLRYSHMGIAVRDHPKGRWTVVHALNDCGSAVSSLYDEGMGNFFLTDLYRHEAQLAIPGPELQARLAQLAAARTLLRLHEPNYNMLSYVYATRYQNSNQWVLELLAAAAAPPGQVETRAEAQTWLRSIGYQPPTVEVPAAVRLGARMFRANVAFDDHPFERRMAGKIDTVSTDAVLRMLRMVDPQARTLTID
ncbi:DUF2145 domain-containing protein [Massilia sp.]|uniref:DUF2145 domain-containing protein n=1 Tax=Massilia sp. TaxID=1882437 RepID=UPI00391CD4A0